jgi:hypothetical protein
MLSCYGKIRTWSLEVLDVVELELIHFNKIKISNFLLFARLAVPQIIYKQIERISFLVRSVTRDLVLTPLVRRVETPPTDAHKSTPTVYQYDTTVLFSSIRYPQP